MEAYEESLTRAIQDFYRNPINIPEAYKLSSCVNYPQWKKFFDYYARRVGHGLPEYIRHTLVYPNGFTRLDKIRCEGIYNTLIDIILKATVENDTYFFAKENDFDFGLDMYEGLSIQFSGSSRRDHFHGVIDSMKELLSGKLSPGGAVDVIRCLKNNDAFNMTPTEILSYLLLHNLDDNSASKVIDDYEVPLDFDQISDKYVCRPDPYAAVKNINRDSSESHDPPAPPAPPAPQSSQSSQPSQAPQPSQPPQAENSNDGDDNSDNSNDTGDEDLPAETSASASTASATNKKKKKKNKKKKNKKKKCARCRDLGHVEEDCIYPYKIPEKVHSITSECFNVISDGLKMDYNNYWFSTTTPAHICNNRKHFEFFVSGYNGPELRSIWDPTSIKVEGVGNVVFVLDSKTIVLRDVLYVPNCPANLVCANLCTRNGSSVRFEDDFVIESKTGMAIASGIGVKGYKFLPVLKLPEELSAAYIID